MSHTAIYFCVRNASWLTFPPRYYKARTNNSTISYAFKALVSRGIAMSLDIRRHPSRTFPARFDSDVKIVEATFVVFRPKNPVIKEERQLHVVCHSV
jgi:hypothetical protein